MLYQNVYNHIQYLCENSKNRTAIIRTSTAHCEVEWRTAYRQGGERAGVWEKKKQFQFRSCISFSFDMLCLTSRLCTFAVAASKCMPSRKLNVRNVLSKWTHIQPTSSRTTEPISIKIWKHINTFRKWPITIFN